ncbi:hypothetical protein Tco_1191582, partial [Tanacetum coccineum]
MQPTNSQWSVTPSGTWNKVRIRVGVMEMMSWYQGVFGSNIFQALIIKIPLSTSPCSQSRSVYQTKYVKLEIDDVIVISDYGGGGGGGDDDDDEDMPTPVVDIFIFKFWLLEESMKPVNLVSGLADKIRNIDGKIIKEGKLRTALRGVVQTGTYVESLDGFVRQQESSLNSIKSVSPNNDASEIFGEPSFVNVAESVANVVNNGDNSTLNRADDIKGY